jgi:hypothetical protein
VNKIVFLLFVSIFYQSVFAQQDGYWDKERATTKEVISARDRIVIKTDDFPVGTTVNIQNYPFDNQKIANSLVSL